MNQYLSVFIEALWNASIVPGASEATLAAMRSFGGFDIDLAATLAIAGAFLGQLFNWLLGVFLLKLKNQGAMPIPPQMHEKASASFQRYFVWFLLFCWLPMFNFFTLTAGFLGVRPRIALPLLLAGTVFHYMFEAGVIAL